MREFVLIPMDDEVGRTAATEIKFKRNRGLRLSYRRQNERSTSFVRWRFFERLLEMEFGLSAEVLHASLEVRRSLSL